MADDESATPELDVHSIDAFWLQRAISEYVKDPHAARDLAEEVFKDLEENEDLRSLENQLVLRLDFDKFDLIKLLLNNRDKSAFYAG